MFINRINLTSDVAEIQNNLNDLLLQTSWIDNQIGLRHRINATHKFQDGVGSLYSREEKKFLSKEIDFSEWSIDDGYLKRQIILLSEEEKIKLGRVRFMRLMPHTGLSVHKDKEFRYHFVLKTNSNAYICNNINSESNVAALCYHIPSDGYWYKVDTTKIHWVYNGGNEERIHLVVCAI